MTPQPQPKEYKEIDPNVDYIVSGLILSRMMTNADNDELIQQLQSRPAPAPECDAPSCCEHCNKEGCWYLKSIKNTAAAQAREKVLLTLIERIGERKIEKWGESERDAIFRSIESLRITPTEAQR